MISGFGCVAAFHFAQLRSVEPTCDPIIKAEARRFASAGNLLAKVRPMPSSSKPIALFIDGANLYATARTLGFDIDYKRLLKEFQSRGTRATRVLLFCGH